MIAMMAMIPRNPGVAEKEAIVWERQFCHMVRGS